MSVINVDNQRDLASQQGIRDRLSVSKDKLHTKPPLNLLELPSEILHLTMCHMDPATFYVSLLTCKAIFALGRSRLTLLHHLRGMPGESLGLEELSLDELFLCFRTRAAQHLCASNILANLCEYNTPGSALSMVSPAFSRGPPALLAAAYDTSTVTIYELAKQDVRLKAELYPMGRGMDSTEARDLEVLKIAFSSSLDVAVLYDLVEQGRGISPLVLKADPTPQCVLRLVVFHRLYTQQKGYFYSSSCQDIRDIPYSKGQKPVSLAMAEDGKVCISWRSFDLLPDYLVVYGRDGMLMEACSYGKFFKYFHVASLFLLSNTTLANTATVPMQS